MTVYRSVHFLTPSQYADYRLLSLLIKKWKKNSSLSHELEFSPPHGNWECTYPRLQERSDHSLVVELGRVQHPLMKMKLKELNVVTYTLLPPHPVSSVHQILG